MASQRVKLLQILFITHNVCEVRYDRYASTVGFWNFFTLRILKDRQTNPRKSAKKLSDFRKSLHVQSRVVVQWDFWETGFGLLFGATWFWQSRNRQFDQRRMTTNFGEPSGQKNAGGRRRDTHTADKVRSHGQTLLFYRYWCDLKKGQSILTPPWQVRAFLLHSCPSVLDFAIGHELDTPVRGS